MLNIYTSYSCKTCKNEFILLTEEVERQLKNNRYIACPYCNSQRIYKEKITNDLRECMKERSYVRKHGALIQK